MVGAFLFGFGTNSIRLAGECDWGAAAGKISPMIAVTACGVCAALAACPAVGQAFLAQWHRDFRLYASSLLIVLDICSPCLMFVEIL